MKPSRSTVIVALAGIVLTLLTLPGTWLMLLVALLCQLWRPEQFSWWTLGLALLLAVIAEIIEFFASAVGARGRVPTGDASNSSV